MSELTKHSLTSIGTNKKEKQDKKVKRTVRFELPLLESNEQAYSQLNYKDLLISREKRDRQKSKERGEVLQNGFDAVASAEDAEMVRRLEEKYGNGEVSGKKKKTKRGRFENFADLGAGYDETDPFIDNTDAYDEVVPEQMTTAHGGFYINCGPLEFKQMSDQSDAEEPVNKAKRRTKRVLSIVEEDEDEDTSDSNSTKKMKGDVVEDNADIIKKKKLSQDLQLLKKKKKHAIDELTKKKTATVKELLKEKRDTLDISFSGSASQEVKKQTLGGENVLARTSITDAIESVVNGAMDDDASQESTASQASKSTAVSLQTSDSEVSEDLEEKEKNVVKEETLLPDNLPEDLKELINGLQIAGKTPAEGKCKFFTMEVNKMLLGVEKICYTLASNNRNLIYKHLESYLPCTKDTLMKRAKKLNIKSEEDKIKKLLGKLKADIDAVMPAILENYGKESQRVVQEKSVEELPSDSEDKPGSVKSRIPRKIFPWTKELQSLALEIIDIKTRCLDLNKTRKESVERNLNAFLDKEVKTLWPPGWMSVPKLLKQKNKKTNIMRKPSKQVSFATNLPVAPPVSISLTVDALVTTTSSAVPMSSSAASVSWSKSSTTITPITSFSSVMPNTNGVLLQGSTVCTQSSAMSPNSVLSQASATHTQSATISPSVSTSTFSSTKCSPPLDKSATSADHKFTSKISEIPNSISRTTTVIVPNSPSKNTTPEIATVVTSSCVLEASSQHNSLGNIPDCINVMPAITQPQTTSANISPPKPMSLKHRILHDAAIDLTNCTKPNLLVAESAVGVLEVGLPVNKVNNDVNMFETVSESHKNDVATKLKPPRRKRKEAKELPPEPQLEQEVEPAPPPQICEKENERRLLEETNAAASFISQIINESLQSFPNASTIRSNSICHKPPSPNCSPPREVPQENKFGSAFHHDLSQSKAVHKKKNMERRPSAADSDMSVQMEVNRVLEELKELQGLSVGKMESVEGDYSSKSSHNSLPVLSSPHINSLGTSVPKLNVDSLLKCNPITNKRSSVGIGFQDEFQKHISQIKQDKVTSVSSATSYPQVNQASVGLHSTIRHTPGADGSQSRNSNGSDMTTNYLKQSITSDPFAGLLFGGVQARNVLNSHFQEKSFDQSGLGVLPGMPTFNPNIDDPFTMSAYGMKTDAGKNQHSSPC